MSGPTVTEWLRIVDRTHDRYRAGTDIIPFESDPIARVGYTDMQPSLALPWRALVWLPEPGRPWQRGSRIIAECRTMDQAMAAADAELAALGEVLP